MEPVPEEIVLKTSLKSALSTLIICALFVIGGVWMLEEKPLIGWLSIIFFGAGIPIISIQTAKGTGYLKLNREGMTIGSIRHGEILYRWEDIEEFGIWEVSGNQFVSWNFIADYDRSKTSRKINKSIGAMEAMLPDGYGMKPVDLLELLVKYKQQSSAS